MNAAAVPVAMGFAVESYTLTMTDGTAKMPVGTTVVYCGREGEGGQDTMEPQVFSPALSLTLPLPPTLPSHFHPLRLR